MRIAAKRYYFPLILCAILILAFLLRVQAFFHGDFFFFQDQSRDLLLVKQIVEGGKIILIGARTGFGGLFHGPLWIYSLIPTYILSFGNPYWTLVPVFLTYSLGIVVAGFVLGWRLYGKLTGIIFAFLLSISAPLIASIYFMTNAHAMPLVFLIYLYFILKYLRGDQKFLIASMFAAGIGFQFEPAFAVLLIPFTLLAIIIVRKFNFKILLLGITAFIFSLSNFIIFDLRHKFLMTQAFLRLIRGGGGAMTGYENYQNIGFRFADRAKGAIDSFLTPLYSSNLMIEAIIFLVLTFSVFLLAKKWREKRKLDQTDREYLFILSFPFFAYLLFILYPYPLWSHYILPIFVASLLVISLSIVRIIKHPVGLLLTVVLIIISLMPTVSSIHSFSFKTSNQPIQSDSSYINQLSVAKWVLNDSGGKPLNYLVYVPSTFTYGMDYLFSWESLVGKNKISPCSKKGLTYLIYYQPLNGDNNAHGFWKKNIIKTHVVTLESREFGGEITVEKINDNGNEPDIDSNYCQNLIFR